MCVYVCVCVCGAAVFVCVCVFIKHFRSCVSFKITIIFDLPCIYFYLCQVLEISCCSVAWSCPTLCDPMDCCTSGFLILHHLPEFAQTHILCADDGIQCPHALLLPSSPAFSLSQHQGVFQRVSSSHLGIQSIGTSASPSVLPMNIEG